MVQVSPISIVDLTTGQGVELPPLGVCQVAAVELIAVNTCPLVGAVLAETLIIVVADFNAFEDDAE